MNVKKMIYRCSAVVLSCVVASVPCMYVCATSPAPLPPNLTLVQPELSVIRGNAYQYALERAGYDFQHTSVQPGVGALEVLAAMEAASNLADMKYQGVEDYDATIQHIKDKSGLPENLQSLNTELYFAKISYLDMELGIYLDELGNRVGNAIVEYTAGIEETVKGWISTIKNNVLGKPMYESFGLSESDIQRMGSITGNIGAISYGISYESYYRHVVRYVNILEAHEDSLFFTVSFAEPEEEKPWPDVLACISKTSPKISYYSGDWYVNKATFAKTVLANLKTGSMYTPWHSGNAFPYREGYGIYFFNLSPLDDATSVSYHSPYMNVKASRSDFETWWRTEFKPSEHIDNSLLLNPNGLSDSVAGKAYDYETMAEHCEAVVTTPPETILNPEPLPESLPEPLPEPLPETAPLYPPISGLDTIPQVKPEIMPDYGPLPQPEPNPNPDDSSDLPEPPVSVAPVTGIKDKFPFCVPFDLIDAFKIMSAEPETPRWVFEFPIPMSSEKVEIVIDFSPFNDLAKLLRTLLLLSFIVALIVGTRNLIAH